MKHTRFLAIILALLLLLTTVGCQKAPAGEISKPTDAVEENNATLENPEADTQPVDTAPTKPEEAFTIPQRDPFASTADEFTNKLSSLLDLSKYDESIYDDYIGYDLDVEYDLSCALDYTVSFAEASSITMPVTFKDMENTDWTTEIPADFQVSNKVQRGIPYTTASGREIILWTTNLDAVGQDDDVKCDLSACTFYEISIDVCTQEYEENEAGEYVGVYYPNPSAPCFTIAGSITESSSIADVINAIGLPSDISFYLSSNVIRISYMVKENDDYSHLIFSFAADGDCMVSVSYEYGI